jgi:hypothetical protein
MFPASIQPERQSNALTANQAPQELAIPTSVEPAVPALEAAGVPTTEAAVAEALPAPTWRRRLDGLWLQTTSGGAAVPSSNGQAFFSEPAPQAQAATAAGYIPPPQPALYAPLTGGIIGSEDQDGLATALWRQLSLDQAARPQAPRESNPAAEPAGTVRQPAPASAGARTTNDTSVAALWLQPFYQTNSAPSSAAGQVNRTARDAAWTAAFLHPFTSTASDETVAGPQALPAPPKLLVERSWDEGWIIRFPSVSNPFLQTQDAARMGAAGAGDARLVAFLQDQVPEPADLDAATGESTAQPDAADESLLAGQGAGEQGPQALADAEQLGREPEDNSLQFLRTATVLLNPGESQCDVGLSYLLTENDFPLLLIDGMDIVGVADARFRVRELTVPTQYRLGLTKRVQGFLSVPVGWANTQIAVANQEAFENDGGLGDISFGATMQLVDATANSPYWVATVASTAPTGGNPIVGTVGLAPSAPSLGQGFWSMSGNLLFIQPYDPVVFFYGLGMEYFFPHDYIGREFQPGKQYSYTFGVGFAVNERVTLSSRFRGSYVEEIEVDGARIFGSNAEPMTLRFSATVSKPCDRIVEPFVEFGLTDDSVSAFFGVTWTFQQLNKDEHSKDDGHGH